MGKSELNFPCTWGGLVAQLKDHRSSELQVPYSVLESPSQSSTDFLDLSSLCFSGQSYSCNLFSSEFNVPYLLIVKQRSLAGILAFKWALFTTYLHWFLGMGSKLYYWFVRNTCLKTSSRSWVLRWVKKWVDKLKIWCATHEMSVETRFRNSCYV